MTTNITIFMDFNWIFNGLSWYYYERTTLTYGSATILSARNCTMSRDNRVKIENGRATVKYVIPPKKNAKKKAASKKAVRPACPDRA